MSSMRTPCFLIVGRTASQTGALWRFSPLLLILFLHEGGGFRPVRKLEKAVAPFGISSGDPQENSGKTQGNMFPNREMLSILGFRAPGKAKLPRSLGGHCPESSPELLWGVTFKMDSYSLLEFL